MISTVRKEYSFVELNEYTLYVCTHRMTYHIQKDTALPITVFKSLFPSFNIWKKTNRVDALMSKNKFTCHVFRSQFDSIVGIRPFLKPEGLLAFSMCSETILAAFSFTIAVPKVLVMKTDTIKAMNSRNIFVCD